MKAASLNEIKKELNSIESQKLLEICLQLARYKKDNKELLSYILFDAGDEASFVNTIKNDLDEKFLDVQKYNLYLANKTIRKILKFTNKYIKYSGSKQSEIELLIYFCFLIKRSGVKIQVSTSLTQLYDRQLKKINLAMSKLHEDLQYDYKLELEKL